MPLPAMVTAGGGDRSRTCNDYMPGSSVVHEDNLGSKGR
jgi:hypothetical protein